MKYLFIISLYVLSFNAQAQMENIPVKFDNKTAYAFTCKGSSGEIVTISDKMDKGIATILPYKTQAVMMYVGKKGTITWMDNTKGAMLKLIVSQDAAGNRVYKTETSHYFTGTVSTATIQSSLSIVQLELNGSYDYNPAPGIPLPNYGKAGMMCFMTVNTAIEGSPADTSMKHAFEVSVTVPDIFYPDQNGNNTYKGKKGRYAGEKIVDARLKWATGFRYENEDSVVLIQITGEGLPEGIPVWVNITPTNSSRWRPGPKYPNPARTANMYYRIFVSENEPGSPHYNIGTGGILFFNCMGSWWEDKLIPAAIITQKNLKEKVNKRPGVYELQDKQQLKNSTPEVQLKVQKATQQNNIINNKTYHFH